MSKNRINYIYQSYLHESSHIGCSHHLAACANNQMMWATNVRRFLTREELHLEAIAKSRERPFQMAVNEERRAFLFELYNGNDYKKINYNLMKRELELIRVHPCRKSKAFLCAHSGFAGILWWICSHKCQGRRLCSFFGATCSLLICILRSIR